jgi:hypothetical protein
MQCTFPYKKCGPGKNRHSVRRFSSKGKTCGLYTNTSPHYLSGPSVFLDAENGRTFFIFLFCSWSAKFPHSFLLMGNFADLFFNFPILFLVRKISFPLATYEKFCGLFLQFSFLVPGVDVMITIFCDFWQFLAKKIVFS